jgi:hypothetical protein
MNIYYVYAYLRKKDLTPYYIGKGKGNRAWARHRNVTTPSDKSKIIILESDLTELWALALERYYIRWYGRKNINYSDRAPGTLHNKTDGGETAIGMIIDDETRKRMSTAATGRKLSEKTKKKMSNSRKGRIVTAETREKISAANKGKDSSVRKNYKCSEVTRQKLSNRVVSEDAKQKIREARKNQIFSEESIQKRADSNRGQKRSEETRQKMIASWIIRKNKKELSCP